jgi:hypothetical protein
VPILKQLPALLLTRLCSLSGACATCRAWRTWLSTFHTYMLAHYIGKNTYLLTR